MNPINRFLAVMAFFATVFATTLAWGLLYLRGFQP
jgi:hypothetical protein